MNALLDQINSVLWHDYVLYIVLGTGVLFTIWSGFGQYRALTHGVSVVRGKYDKKGDPGAINHFQALSTALSATVGLGNIGGVALAIALGGPGAVFWMWMVGLFGMALKMTEVTLAMLYRDTSDPDNPHGGPMWVAKRGFARWSPALAPLGAVVGGIFCITLIISAITGGNMFQAWNVAEITNGYFPSIPKFVVGAILATTVAMVIIGGIKRIGAVAGRLVPFMCVLYMLAALYVLVVHIGDVPAMLRLIVVSAFTPTEAVGAFLGGTWGYAFLWGMKRALFSSEAGQGSAPIAHAAAKTDEPVREGVVSGLEPFIDTIVVCTLTTLVILLSGAWNREPEAFYGSDAAMEVAFSSPQVSQLERIPEVQAADKEDHWTLAPVSAPPRVDQAQWQAGQRVFTYLELPGQTGPNRDGLYPISGRVVQNAARGLVIEWDPVATPERPRGVEGTLYGGAKPTWEVQTPPLPPRTPEARRILGVPGWRNGESIFLIVHAEPDANTGQDLRRVHGTVVDQDSAYEARWDRVESIVQPRFRRDADQVPQYGVYGHYVGAALTGHAFDRVMPGLGMWLVTIACWLFAISTMISWAYYGEQGVIYLVGSRGVLLYKLGYCSLIIVATLGFIRTDEQLDAWTALGTGVMLFANIPIMLLFGYQAMKAYHRYLAQLDAGEFKGHAYPPLTDVVEGRDVE
jgi:alanine or glycine:cation symporter, AGCS family